MKKALIRLAGAACLSLAATSAHATYFCVTQSVTARSGPGSSYGSVGKLNAGNRLFGLHSVGGWRKIVGPTAGLYFVPDSALARGECPTPKTRKSVTYAAPSHCGHCGHGGHKRH